MLMREVLRLGGGGVAAAAVHARMQGHAYACDLLLIDVPE